MLDPLSREGGELVQWPLRMLVCTEIRHCNTHGLEYSGQLKSMRQICMCCLENIQNVLLSEKANCERYIRLYYLWLKNTYMPKKNKPQLYIHYSHSCKYISRKKSGLDRGGFQRAPLIVLFEDFPVRPHSVHACGLERRVELGLGLYTTYSELPGLSFFFP